MVLLSVLCVGLQSTIIMAENSHSDESEIIIKGDETRELVKSRNLNSYPDHVKIQLNVNREDSDTDIPSAKLRVELLNFVCFSFFKTTDGFICIFQLVHSISLLVMCLVCREYDATGISVIAISSLTVFFLGHHLLTEMCGCRRTWSLKTKLYMDGSLTGLLFAGNLVAFILLLMNNIEYRGSSHLVAQGCTIMMALEVTLALGISTLRYVWMYCRLTSCFHRYTSYKKKPLTKKKKKRLRIY